MRRRGPSSFMPSSSRLGHASSTETPENTDDTETPNQQSDTAVDSIMWLEGEEGVVRLPVDEPDIFADYVQLLYTGALAVYKGSQKHTKRTTKKHKTSVAMDMSKAVNKANTKLSDLYVLCGFNVDRRTNKLSQPKVTLNLPH